MKNATIIELATALKLATVYKTSYHKKTMRGVATSMIGINLEKNEDNKANTEGFGRNKPTGRVNELPGAHVLCYVQSLFYLGDVMKLFIWKFVLRWIRDKYIFTDERKASQIVDCCTYLIENIDGE